MIFRSNQVIAAANFGGIAGSKLWSSGAFVCSDCAQKSTNRFTGSSQGSLEVTRSIFRAYGVQPWSVNPLHFSLLSPSRPCYKTSPMFRALLILAVLFAALPAFAQYEVSLKLDRINYVSQEPMMATVTIVNRSGADVILGGPGGRPWLSFNVKDSQERSHSPLQSTSDEPVIFEAGSTMARKVQLGETHSVTEEGTYSITVSAYHQPQASITSLLQPRAVSSSPTPSLTASPSSSACQRAWRTRAALAAT